MRLLLASLLALTAACTPPKARSFRLGIIGPIGPRAAAAARAAGLPVVSEAPEGAETLSAGVVSRDASGAESERIADWSLLRLLTARAAVRGRAGVFFTLPKPIEGREAADYPEEWQALARVARETAALRPILESGVEAPAPFSAAGVEARAWRFRGRLYVLLVNDSGADAAVREEDFRPWRALFEVRADARELLAPCSAGRCLAAGRALWLEGRL